MQAFLLFQKWTNCGAVICQKSTDLAGSDFARDKACWDFRSFNVYIVVQLRKLEFQVVSDLNELSSVCNVLSISACTHETAIQRI